MSASTDFFGDRSTTVSVFASPWRSRRVTSSRSGTHMFRLWLMAVPFRNTVANVSSPSNTNSTRSAPASPASGTKDRSYHQSCSSANNPCL